MKPNVGTADRIMRIAPSARLIMGGGPSLTQAAHAIAGFEEFSQVPPN